MLPKRAVQKIHTVVWFYVAIPVTGRITQIAMKFFSSLLIPILLGGCATVQQDSRISANLQAMEFNSVASRYMTRPTFVSVKTLTDGKTILSVTMQGYGPSMAANELAFARSHVSEYVAAIDKYLEWAQLAKQRNDQLTKEIVRVPTWPESGLLKFTFHSGNERDHYLSICFGTSIAFLDAYAQSYDEINARELRRLLVDFQSESLKKTDESIYR